MNEEWYYLDSNNQKQGPFSKNDIIQKIKSFELPDDILVISSNNNERTPANEAFNLIKSNDDSDEIIIETDTKEIRYEKVGGWLMFFCLTLVLVSPLMVIFSIIVLVSQDYIASYLKQYFFVDELIQISLAFYAIYTGTQLLVMASNAVKIAQRFLKAQLVVASIGIILPYILIESGYYAEDFLLINLRGLASSVIYYSIWSSYFKKSKRVKATFDLY